ncbi:kelch repeat-containing protein [Archangium violaceum]|uniref:kelch repeat-containing protein n=1 Tax=Archangium violaceum TaxID=83451 RepID=UPI001EF54793|nr:kelch repeat-containing protein [Archangium violaceum]
MARPEEEVTRALPAAPAVPEDIDVCVSGKVLVVGGQNNESPQGLASAELYDPATNTWSTVATMPHPRYDELAATVLASSQVLVTGGRSSARSAPSSSGGSSRRASRGRVDEGAHAAIAAQADLP